MRVYHEGEKIKCVKSADYKREKGGKGVNDCEEGRRGVGKRRRILCFEILERRRVTEGKKERTSLLCQVQFKEKRGGRAELEMGKIPSSHLRGGEGEGGERGGRFSINRWSGQENSLYLRGKVFLHVWKGRRRGKRGSR